jgi:hypothetical protein
MAETTLAAISDSKVARRLDWLGGLVAIALFCRLALDEDLAWVGWLIVSIAVIFLTQARWPYGSILVLVGMSAMPRFFLEIFGWKARPEHFAAIIVSVAVALWLHFHQRPVRLSKLDYWILAYVAINYVSSIVGSPQPSSTLKWALQNNLAVLPYFLIRLTVQDLETLRKAFQILLGVGVAESVYGILCYASNHAFGTKTGMEIGAYLVNVAAPFGSLYEPNLFGAYTACCAVLFLALYLAERQQRLSYLIGFLIASLAAVLSFSRVALFALVLVAGWVFWRTRRLWKHGGGRSKSGIFVLGFALIIFIFFSVGAVLRERFSDLYYEGLTEQTTISRFIVILQALQEIPNHPLLGSGTASFNLSFDWANYIPEWSSDKTWIANAPLRILHDCGALGLTAVLGFLVSVSWKIRRAWGGRDSPVAMLLALVAGALLYGISFQATDGTILAFCWVHLGFLSSAASLLPQWQHPKGTGRVIENPV